MRTSFATLALTVGQLGHGETLAVCGRSLHFDAGLCCPPGGRRRAARDDVPAGPKLPARRREPRGPSTEHSAPGSSLAPAHLLAARWWRSARPPPAAPGSGRRRAGTRCGTRCPPPRTAGRLRRSSPSRSHPPGRSAAAQDAYSAGHAMPPSGRCQSHGRVGAVPGNTHSSSAGHRCVGRSPERRHTDTRTAPASAGEGERARSVARGHVEHGAVQQRSGAGHAAHLAHRAAAEVARPHGDGEAARHGHGPVVGEVMARARLHGDGEGEVERRVNAEADDAGHRVAEDVQHQRCRAARETTRRVPCTLTGGAAASATHVHNHCYSSVRQRPVPVRHRKQSDVPIAEGQAQAVVLGALLQGEEAGVVQDPEQAAHAIRSASASAGRLSEEARASRARTGPVETAVVVARLVRAGRRLVGVRNVGQHRRAREAAVEREAVEKRLQGRARLARRDHHVHLAGGVGPEVRRADPRQDLARAVVEHDGRGLAYALVFEQRDGVAPFGLELRLQREVERGVPGAGERRASPPPTASRGW